MQPSRLDNLPDVIANNSSMSIDVQVDDTGCVFDHRLVIASVTVQFTAKKSVAVKTAGAFGTSLCRSSSTRCAFLLCLQLLPFIAEEFLEQMQEIIIIPLNHVALLYAGSFVGRRKTSL
jgi:hypothetical protein